jgi:hypothetical protein
MRLWMCNTVILCRKHLVAEYNECKMFIGTLKKGISINGYIKNDLLEPLSLIQRHQALSREMFSRGYKTNIKIEDFQVNYSHLTSEQINHKIDRKNSLRELLRRCPECLARFKQYKDYISALDAFEGRYFCQYCKHPLTINSEEINDISNIACDNCKEINKIHPYKILYVTKSEDSP